MIRISLTTAALIAITMGGAVAQSPSSGMTSAQETSATAAQMPDPATSSTTLLTTDINGVLTDQTATTTTDTVVLPSGVLPSGVLPSGGVVTRQRTTRTTSTR
jgi:hypothetical protein